MDLHNFVHLNVHSHYSLLQSTATINDIVYTARRLNMPAIALTDHGRLFGIESR
jgi:DNA polymerase-3 subunit alpha